MGIGETALGARLGVPPETEVGTWSFAYHR
jgi:hypothetical protein